MSKTTETHHYFWRSPLGQWSESPFIDTETGIKFNTAEQYMMYKKAELFNDPEVMSLILSTSDPREQKNLGRLVKGYSDEKWNEVCIDIVAHGNYLKFTQNDKHLQILLGTGSRVLVEASPYDKKWGVGLAEDDERILDEKNWKGENFLGKALMKTRERIQKESGELNGIEM